MAKKITKNVADKSEQEDIVLGKSYNEEDLKILNLEEGTYKTLIPKKYADRKRYEPKDPRKVFSYIPGTIKKVYVKEGKKVAAGEKLIDLEAMKMVNTIVADGDYTIEHIFVKEGNMIPKNFLMIQFK